MSTSLEKKKLLAQSDHYKDELERELKMVKLQTNELIKNALIIGGSLALTYIIFRQITSHKRKKRAVSKALVAKNDTADVEGIVTLERPSRFASMASDIGTTIANEATFFLLNLAKEKLLELLTPKETNESKDEDS